jgi:TonB family protein
MNWGSKVLKFFVAAIVFGTILLISGNVLAQTPQDEREREANERDLQQRAWNLRMLSIIAAQKRPQTFDPQRALSQVQEDFKRIQLINKPLGLMALGQSAFDLNFVTKSAAEINKRAERLKENLALPEPADDAPTAKQYTADNSAQLKVPIVNLARLILDFTSNPFFKDAGVVDIQAYRAHRDLDDIIRLSAEVRDLSQKLGQGVASGQKPTNPDREAQIALAALRRPEIPEATLPSSPDEMRWWEEIQSVGTIVKKSRDKDGDKFLRLLKEGVQKSYRPPIPNRGPTFLRRVPPEYSEEARRNQISGGIALVVEFLSDGKVGEVTIVKGLGFGLDQSAAAAARKSVFLPAVKDRQFVTMCMPMTMSFNLGDRIRD